MDLVQELIELAEALEAADVEFAVCGGLAMAAHGLVRATEDIDILIPQENLETTREVAESCGFTILGGEIPLKPGTAEEGMIFRISKVIESVLVPLDIILVTPAYEAAWNQLTLIRLHDTQLPVVSRDGMISMKLLAGGPKDQSDLEFLRSKDD